MMLSFGLLIVGAFFPLKASLDKSSSGRGLGWAGLYIRQRHFRRALRQSRILWSSASAARQRAENETIGGRDGRVGIPANVAANMPLWYKCKRGNTSGDRRSTRSYYC